MLMELLKIFDNAPSRINHSVSLSREVVRILLRWSCKVPDVHMLTGISQRTISRERNRDGGGLMAVTVTDNSESGEARARRLRVTGTIDERIVTKRTVTDRQLQQILDAYLRLDDPYLTDLLALGARFRLSLSALIDLIVEHVGPDRYALRKCVNCPPSAPLVLSPHPGIRLCKAHAQDARRRSLSVFTPMG
jgi:hypothetical protein